MDFTKHHLGGGFGAAGGPRRSAGVGGLPSSVAKYSATAGAAYTGLIGLDAYARHKQFMKMYQQPPPPPPKFKTDSDVLHEEHRFLRDDESDPAALADWSKRLAIRYYSKLHKHYALTDLTRYREGKIGFRWRTESEVISGKGQFTCANLKCDESTDLRSYEVNFGYKEAGEHKNALVKVKVCPACALKLFHRKVEELKKKRKLERRKAKKKEKKAKRKEGKRRKRRGEGEEEEERARAGSSSDGSEAEDSDGEEGGEEEEDTAALLAEVAGGESAAAAAASKIWSAEAPKEATRKDEFEEYFKDMFD